MNLDVAFIGAKIYNNSFFVIDFMVAGISLIQTKRSEFNSMLKKWMETL